MAVLWPVTHPKVCKNNAALKKYDYIYVMKLK